MAENSKAAENRMHAAIERIAGDRLSVALLGRRAGRRDEATVHPILDRVLRDGLATAYREGVAAALASIAGARAGDWVTVPREVSIPMRIAFNDHHARGAQTCWDAVLAAAPAVPASPIKGGEHPLDSEAEQMRLAVALTSGDHETANEIYGRAWYVDVCRAEQRLKEFVAAGKALLASLPDHWHDDATVAMRDLVEGTDIVLRPGFFTKAQQEIAFREYGARSIVPTQSAALPGEGEAKRRPTRAELGPRINHLADWLVSNSGIGTLAAASVARALILRNDSPFAVYASPPAPAEHGAEIRAQATRWAATLRNSQMRNRKRDWLSLHDTEVNAILACLDALSQGGGAGRSKRAVEIRELSEKATQGEKGRVPAAPGSRADAPSPSVSASGFDPSRDALLEEILSPSQVQDLNDRLLGAYVAPHGGLRLDNAEVAYLWTKLGGQL